MVYLVDDDSDDLEVIHEALVQSSYKGIIRTAENGQVLMRALQDTDSSSKPNVIVLDLNMPLKNGFETLRDIKADPHLRNIPVIILTASSNKHDEIRCFELGCSLFFRKPHTLHGYAPIVTAVKKYVVFS